MAEYVEVRTQKDFELVLKAGKVAVCVGGKLFLATKDSECPVVVVESGASLHVEAWGSSQPHIEARESSQPHVEAWESSQPRVEARESSQPHVEARESSQPRVEAWGSSQPHVEARESSQPHVEARESSQPHVVAWESSQPHVEARESSQPHVVAWGSSQPHVEARGSSQPHVVAWENSQPHVEAWGYVQLSVRGRVKVTASRLVSVLVRGAAEVIGGIVTTIQMQTAADWCEYYGVRVENGVARLYKAVDDEYCSLHGMSYAPGTIPVARDWDGGKEECGGGLHFSPSPVMASAFVLMATRFVACDVALQDIAIHPDGAYPEKCKARACCAPVFEVDVNGEPIQQQNKAAA